MIGHFTSILSLGQVTITFYFYLVTGNKDQNMNNAEAFQREYISSVVSKHSY